MKHDESKKLFVVKEFANLLWSFCVLPVCARSSAVRRIEGFVHASL